MVRLSAAIPMICAQGAGRLDEPLADRVLAGPVAGGERLVDHGDARRVRRVRSRNGRPLTSGTRVSK